MYCTKLHYIITLFFDPKRPRIADGVSNLSSYVEVSHLQLLIQLLKSKAKPPPESCSILRIHQSTASIPNITANRPLLTLMMAPELAPFEDPVGVFVLLVGAEVPLADDAELVAPDVDALELDLLVDVWLVVDDSDLVVVVLVLVEGEEVEEEVVEEEVDAVVVVADDEELADSTEPEPSTLISTL